MWETTATAIRTDLRTFLVEDERWRREHRFEPRHIEQSFGMQSSDSWNVLEFELVGGKLRFRGFIDRVDLDPNGRRAHVFDYKTGGLSSYKELADDPLMGGEHLQLALYKQSVHAAYPELEDIGATFWFISSKGKFERLPRDESAIPTDERLKEVLEGVVGGIDAGAFPQVPGAETERPGKRLGQLRLLRVHPCVSVRSRRRVGAQEGRPGLRVPRGADAGQSRGATPEVTATLGDEDVRKRLLTDFETTFLVEAGAGTGKTTVLVDRIVGLVSRGTLTMDRLAAITFTEAAAARAARPFATDSGEAGP